MKKIIFAIFALLTTTAAMAQRHVAVTERPVAGQVQAAAPAVSGPRHAEGLSSAQRPVGYWPTDSITLTNVAIGASGTYPVGAYITNNMLRSYAGCKVVGVRFAVGEYIGRTRAFIYKVNSDGNITEEPVTQMQRAYEGWNNVFFNAEKEFELDGTEELIVGYDYIESDEMVAADRGAICTVGMEADEEDEGKLQGTEFVIYGNFGQGEDWFSITNTGMLCAQLILDVSSLPAKAIDMSYLDTGFRYKQAGELIEMLATVANVGREEVNNYELFCQIDDLEPTVVSSERRLDEGASETYQPVLQVPADIAVGKHTVRVGVKSIEGTAVAASARTVFEQQFYVYAHPLTRNKVYVEQYTDQDAAVANDVNAVFNSALSMYPNACMVNIYKPGNPLAISESAYLTNLYAYTLPCFTSNRSYFPGEMYIAYDVNDYLQIGTQNVINWLVLPVIDQDYSFASFATIGMKPAYDPATRQLTVEVNGSLSEDALPIYGDLAVTLMLTEDGVTSYQRYVNTRTGRIATNNNYKHNHVLRAYITAPTGDKVETQGDTYSGSFSITLDEAWNPENLNLVGIVTRYAEAVTADNIKEMDVTNADAMSLKAVVSGISELSNNAETSEPAEIYNLSGQRVNRGYRGIVVVKGKKYQSVQY